MNDDFNWEDYPQAAVAPSDQFDPDAKGVPAESEPFNWDDHPIVGTVQSPTVSQPPSATEALVRGGLQGATLGFGDEIQAGLKAGEQKLFGDDGGGGQSFESLYNQDVGQERAENAAAQQAHPYLYGAGNFTGALGLGAVTGGLGAETAVGRIGAASAMGALSGVGYGNDDSLNNGAAEALKGALVGGAVGGAVEGLSSAFDPDNLDTFAANRSAAALGADKAAIRRLGADKVQEIGRNALDEDIVGPFRGTDAMASRAQDLMDQGAQGMNDVYSTLDNAGVGQINPADLASDVEDQLSPTYRTPINKGEWGQLDNTVESILARGEGGGNSEIPLSEAQGLKNEIGSVAYPNGRTVNPAFITPKQQMAQDAWGVVNQAIDDAAQRGAQSLGDPDLTDQLQAAKDQFGTGKGALNLLGNRAAKEQGNNFFGLGDQVAGAAGYLGSGSPAGLAAMGVKKAILNPYGNGTVAWGADRLADVIRSAPQLLGPFAPQLQAAAARSPVSLAATAYILNQTSAPYRALQAKLFNGGQE